MKVSVTVYGPLRSATGTKTVEVEVAGDRWEEKGDEDGRPVATIADVLAAFVEAYPRAEAQLLDDDGQLRPSVRVAIDGERAEPGNPVSDGVDLTLHPAVQGGAGPRRHRSSPERGDVPTGRQ